MKHARNTTIALLSAILLAACNQQDVEEHSETPGTGTALRQSAKMYEVYDGILKPVDGPPTVTLAHFEQIKPEMTYDQAVAIIGAEADIITDREVMPTLYVRRVAKWVNGNASDLTLTFADMRLQSKDQNGLE